MAVIRVGSIGLGGISGGVHLPGIKGADNLELTALCDINENRLAERAKQYGIPAERCFTDYRELIACPEVDVVDISTPNNVHWEIAMEACRAGKSYGVEKPITMDSEQADTLLAATEKAGVRSMVYFSYRYQPAARYAKDLIASGRLGKLHHVSMQYYQGWGLESKDCPLVWRFVKSVAASGALGDLGCHGLDLAQFVTGQQYEKVSAHLGTIVKERRLPEGDGRGPVDVDDFSNILAAMDGGTSATFQISRFCRGRGNYQRMEIYGDRAALVYHLDREPGKNELEICEEATGDKYVPMEIPAQYFVSQMKCFGDEMQGQGDGCNADIAVGVKNQHLLDAILQADTEEKWVSVR